ncbi:DnaJ domain-containing protein [archaeon]|nr:DnaJ domain-containing protein [archaeon]
MTDLVLTDRLGDINFGLPEDLAPHRKPWAYYEILGVRRDTTPEEIARAYRRLSRDVHPDKVAGTEAETEAERRQKVINTIKEVLLDDGGELGKEWGRRNIYDTISGYGEFFGTAHVEHRGQRTVTIAENLLDLLELKKEAAKTEHQFRTENPDIADAIARLEQAIQRNDRYSARQHHAEIIRRFAEKEGVTPEEFVKEQERLRKELERKNAERAKRTREFEGRLFAELTRPMATGASKAGDMTQPDKIFDIWYNGRKDDFSTVTFGTSGVPYCSMVGYEESDRVVRMGLKGNAVLTGMRKAHFKAKCAKVTLKDAHLEGVFQVVDGSVTVEYEGSSYGTVIRARAPDVTMSGDFVQHGDRYIPKPFATEGWEKRKPAVDIAVFAGTVSLRLKRPEVQQMPRYDGELSYYKKDLTNIIITSNNIHDKYGF